MKSAFSDNLWENAPSGLAFCTDPQWHIACANTIFYELLQVSKEQCQGNVLWDILELRGLEGMRDLLEQGKEQSPFVFQQQNMLWTGSWKNYTQDGVLGKLLTLQKVQLDELGKQVSILWSEVETLFDALHDGIWVIDAEGITRHINKAMLEMAGLQEQEIIGRHVSAPMRQGQYSACVTLRALEEKKAVTMFDDYANGRRFLNTSTPILDNTGKVWRVIACIRDMSRLEEMQKRLIMLENDNALYKDRIHELEQESFPDFIGTSSALRRMLQDISRAARVDSIALILGETGVGKTLAANAIHMSSSRRAEPFVVVNCGAIPETLIESELFGYEKGAFTGAQRGGKMGLFEAAGKGTIFLDEIAELPLALQVKLLHVLDNNGYTRVGGVVPKQLEARVIAATNKPLEELVAAGDFREDLFYRLHVLHVRIPALRDRVADIPMLTKHFVSIANEKNGMNKRFDPAVLACFSHYDWPGNVRELRATVEYLVAMSEGGYVTVEDLPERIRMHVKIAELAAKSEALGLKKALDELEKSMLVEALQMGGSTWKAAEILKISQSSVVRKAQKYRIGVTEIVHSQ